MKILVSLRFFVLASFFASIYCIFPSIYCIFPSICYAEPHSFAVLELFTSQGCSSCPPADRLLQEIKEKNDDNILVLSYHVDYWNYIGWNDPFSLPEASQFQRRLANTLGSSVFTPQLIINGNASYVGSKREESLSGLQRELSITKKNVSVNATRSSDTISFYITNAPQEYLVQAVSYQPKTRATVKSGENRGRTLSHVNSVEWFSFTPSKNPRGEVTVPAFTKEKAQALIIRNPKSFSVLGFTHILPPSPYTKTLSR